MFARLPLIVLALLLLSLGASFSPAQVPDPVAAAQVPIPGAGHNYIGIGAETVNPADGSLSFDLPFQTPQGRQLSFPFGIHYNASERFSPSGTGPNVLWGKFLAPPFQLDGWNYQLPVYTASTYKAFYGLDPQQHSLYCDYAHNYVFRGFDGIQRGLGLNAQWPDGGTNQYNCRVSSNAGIPADDFLTGMNGNTFPMHPVMTITDPSGTTYQFPSYLLSASVTDTPWGLLAQTITDRNGNQITFTGASNSGTSGSYRDTLGRPIVAWSGLGNASGDQLTVAGLSSNVVVKWTQKTESFPESGRDVFDNGVAGPCSMTPNQTSPQQISVVSEIDLPGTPSGTKYVFSYDPTYARPNKITFPGGGYVRYAWGLNSSSASSREQWPAGQATAVCTLRYDTAAITDRWVSYDGVTEVLHQQFYYAPTTWDSAQPQNWLTKSTTVTSTDLLTGQVTKTIYNYTPQGQTPVEQQIIYQDGSNNTLKTVNKTWENIFHQIGEQIILDNGQGKVTLRCYGGNLQVTDVYEYGFQSEGSKPPDPACPTYPQGLSTGLNAAAMGPLKRHTAIVYHTFPSTYIVNEADSVTVYDGTGAQAKQTGYAYDGSPVQASGAVNLVPPVGLRGNLTSASRWINTGGTSITSYAYYDTGQVQTVIDPCGNATCSDLSGTSHTTNYSYADNYATGTGTPSGQTFAYVTQVTRPNTGVAHVDKYTWGFNDGFLRSHIDENNNIASTYQYNDPLSRLTLVTRSDSGTTSHSYNDTPSSPSVTTSTLVSTGTSGVSVTNVAITDGLGHVVQTQLPTDPDGTTYTAATYDGFARTRLSYNPTRCNPPITNCNSDLGGSVWGYTTTAYDALGRVTQVSQQDSQIVTTSYNGNCVTVTDEAGKARKSCSDALGRLTQVFEDPAGLNYETDYGYDTLGNLLSVTQKGGTTASSQWRVRTFSYDSLSRLTSATNPESGTITYLYDANGNLTSKTSPAPNQTGSATVTISYCYDALNRLTSKAYTAQSCPMSSPGATYSYDQSSFNGLTITNGIGRRTGMTDQAGSEAWSYDSMGRIAADKRTTNGITNTFSYTYNLDESLATVQDPSAPIENLLVTFQPGGAGRPISEYSRDATYATNVHYAPNGALCYWEQGWGSTTYANRTFNNRLQPLRIWQWGYNGAPPPVTPCQNPSQTANLPMDFTYSYTDANGHNNGNVVYMETTGLTDRSQSFTYDSLNRISTASTWGINQPAFNGDTDYMQDCWSEQFSYDAWGNLLSIGPTSSSNYTGCSQESGFNFTGAISTKNQIATTGYQYDSAGNLIVAPPTGTAYTFDAENHLLSAGGQTYIYDGDGKRVEKASGSPLTANKLYWYGTEDSPVIETDSAGHELARYFRFQGILVARNEPNDWVNHYGVDALGNVRWMYGTNGQWDISDYYPFGGERVFQSHSNNSRKFTSKERDPESGNDYFGARFYSSSLGRFMTPDWSAAPAGVPYADFGNPQSLNLYSYVRNNPLRDTDPDGHCCEEALDIGQQIFEQPSPAAKVLGGLVIAAAVIGTAATHWDSVKDAASQVQDFVMAHPAVDPQTVISGGFGSGIYMSESRPGTLGKPDHQQTVKEEAANYPNGQTEVTVETPGGEKTSRRIDAANVENGRVTDATQVIRPNKNGTAPAREVRAANDIENATGVKPKMVPVRPKPSTPPKPEPDQP